MQISLKNISKSFGDHEVIKNISLEIDSGSFTTLLGPSGCGKTTLLRMIAGFEEPSSGEIYFGERCVYSSQKSINLPPEDRYLGFVFQDFALWPHLSVWENVAFPLKARKSLDQLDQKVQKALETVQLGEYSDYKPSQLSGGQQQRVAFARAIVSNPEIILFDEPFSALDAILREGMRLELKNLASEYGFTSIFVTHDQLEAMAMSDQIAVMWDGNIEQYASPEEVYNSPASEFVANFIGSSNWLTDTVLFRPEKASLNPSSQAKCYKTKIINQEFLGSSYKYHLSYEDKLWTIEASQSLPLGIDLDVYVNDDELISV